MSTVVFDLDTPILAKTYDEISGSQFESGRHLIELLGVKSSDHVWISAVVQEDWGAGCLKINYLMGNLSVSILYRKKSKSQMKRIHSRMLPIE